MANTVVGAILVTFTFIWVEAHVEWIADKPRSARALSTVVGRGTHRVLATQKLLARVLTNVYIIRAVHADGIGGTHVMAEAFVWN